MKLKNSFGYSIGYKKIFSGIALLGVVSVMSANAFAGVADSLTTGESVSSSDCARVTNTAGGKVLPVHTMLGSSGGKDSNPRSGARPAR